MAIACSVKTQFGVDATYWRVIAAVADYRTDVVSIVLAGYASAEARAAKAEPMAILPDIRLTQLKASTEPRRAEVYAALVALAETIPPKPTEADLPDHPLALLRDFIGGVEV